MVIEGYTRSHERKDWGRRRFRVYLKGPCALYRGVHGLGFTDSHKLGVPLESV